jgi:hypothetical protein
MTAQIQRDRLGTLTKIARGGQGVVYHAPNANARFGTSVVQNVTSMDFFQCRADARGTAYEQMAAIPLAVPSGLQPFARATLGVVGSSDFRGRNRSAATTVRC